MSCEHKWRHVYEEFLLGGSFPIGWECVSCGEFVSVMKPGTTGTDTNEKRLVGAHGGCGRCSDGSVYKEQIVRADGTVEIIRP